MNVSEERRWRIGDNTDVTSDDVDRLLHVIDALRTVLFTRDITLDRLIYQLSLPLIFVAKPLPREARFADVIGDFFLLSLHDFLCKYLSVLAELSPEQKQILFRVKSRLSCALHFNYDLTEIELADECRHRDNEAGAVSHVDKNTVPGMNIKRLGDAPPLDSVYTKRVSFVRHGVMPFSDLTSPLIDTTRVLTIESFCPTFSLYTVVNLHSRCQTAVDDDRFIPISDNADSHDRTGMTEINMLYRHASRSQRGMNNNRENNDQNDQRPARKRRICGPRASGDEEDNVFRDTRICQPPDGQSWYALCQEGGDRGTAVRHNSPASFWPKQIVLQNSRDIMNDSTMRELLHRLSRSDANATNTAHQVNKSAEGDNASITGLSLSRRGRGAAIASRFRSNLSNGHDGNDTHLFVERHWYTNDVESYVDQRRRLRHVNDSHSAALNGVSDFKHHYELLLHRFSINWAKLHFMEPGVFGKSGHIRA